MLIQVLLTHPYFWPHVARGAEREVHDVGSRLAERGHDVRLLTGQPAGLTAVGQVDGIRVRYVRTPSLAPLAGRGWTRENSFGVLAAGAALASRADVVVSYLYSDAYGASLASRLPGRRRPVVLKLTGAVPKRWIEERGERLQGALLRRALEAADEVWVNSAYVVDAMKDWGREMHVVPAGVDEQVFTPRGERAPYPLVVCAAAPEEPRKRIGDLLAGWPQVLRSVPDARLVLAGRASAETQARMLAGLPADVRGSVSFVGVLDDVALADAYSRAWATVVPSVHEALGLTTLESLACGTPVAGAESGATPDLLRDRGTGVVFRAADPEALAAAVLEALPLGQEAAVRARCRAAALRYAWPQIVEEIDRRLHALVRS